MATRIVKRRFLWPWEVIVLWKLYDEAFVEINKDSICRQSFHRNDFLSICINPHFLKIFLVENGKPVGFTVYTTRYDLLPWVSELYFKNHYPNQVVSYVPIIAVPLDKRGLGYVQTLFRELLKQYIADDAVVLGFDTACKNEFLAQVILRALPGSKMEGGKTVDSQLYYLLSYQAER